LRLVGQLGGFNDVLEMVLERVNHLLDVLMIQLNVLVRDVSLALLDDFNIVYDGFLERLPNFARRFVLFCYPFELLSFGSDLFLKICL
jgi:hypothetical protein